MSCVVSYEFQRQTVWVRICSGHVATHHATHTATRVPCHLQHSQGCTGSVGRGGERKRGKHTRIRRKNLATHTATQTATHRISRISAAKIVQHTLQHTLQHIESQESAAKIVHHTLQHTLQHRNSRISAAKIVPVPMDFVRMIH